jgi:hypothetical protein
MNSERCEIALRAIGQALELLNVQSFNLNLSEGRFTVHGVAEKSKGQIVPKTKALELARQIFRRVSTVEGAGARGHKKLPSSFVFSGLQFSEEKLDELERQGQARRVKSAGGPDPYGLSQLLRTVGAYVDQKKRHFIHVSYADDRVAIRYREPLGGEKTEEFTKTNLYDLWVHMYKLRGEAATRRAV